MQKIIHFLKDVTRPAHFRAVLARSNNPARPHYLLAEPCLTTHAHISWKNYYLLEKSLGRALSYHTCSLRIAHTRFEKNQMFCPRSSCTHATFKNQILVNKVCKFVCKLIFLVQCTGGTLISGAKSHKNKAGYCFRKH